PFPTRRSSDLASGVGGGGPSGSCGGGGVGAGSGDGSGAAGGRGSGGGRSAPRSARASTTVASIASVGFGAGRRNIIHPYTNAASSAPCNSTDSAIDTQRSLARRIARVHQLPRR